MKRIAALKVVCLVVLLSAVPARAANSDVADAAMKGNKAALRSLVQQKADVNVAQVDGTTALDRKSTRLNSSHVSESRMPSSA